MMPRASLHMLILRYRGVFIIVALKFDRHHKKCSILNLIGTRKNAQLK